MDTTNEPRTDIIISLIDLVFNALSVVTNLITSQLPDLFTNLLTQILAALGLS